MHATQDAPAIKPAKQVNVNKRDGKVEEYDVDKIHRICNWAVEGLADVSVSDIEMRTSLLLFDGITTAEIHESIIQSAVDLISEKQPNYAKVAARLLLYKLRKETWGSKNPPTLKALITANIKEGYYDPELVTAYTEREIDKLGEHMNHQRDDMFDYGGLVQMMEKYLIQNRDTKLRYETPQFAFMAIAMAVYMFADPATRMKHIKNYYDDLSKFRVNAPTPILAGARTPTRSWSSCCLLSVDDTKASLFAANTTVGLATCDRYGIGIDMGRIRPVNSPIRNGESLHSGVIPWLKIFQETVNACQQGGARRGAGTITFPIFHPEIMTVMELKNNQGTHENRVPHMDYSIGMSNLFYKRYIEKKDITLFSSQDAVEVYDAWGTPQFDEVYEAAEKAGKGHSVLPARELFNKFFKERYETGRIYCINVDQANLYSPWTAPVTQSNLCVAGDQLVVSTGGLQTAQELYEVGGELTLFDGEKEVESTEMKLMEKNVPTYKITLENGMTHTVTAYHKIKVRTSESGNRPTYSSKTCAELAQGDQVCIQTNKGLFGEGDMVDEAFLLGLYQADGTQHKETIFLDIWENDFDLEDEIKTKFDTIHYNYGCNRAFLGGKGTREVAPANFHECQTSASDVRKRRLASRTLKKALNFEKGYVPSWVLTANESTQWQYVRGLFYADGTVTCSKDTPGQPVYLSITNTNQEFLQQLQILLRNLGMSFNLYLNSPEKDQLLPDGKGGRKLYSCKASYRLVCGNKPDAIVFNTNTGFLDRKGIKLEDREYRDNTRKQSAVASVDYVKDQDVYCVGVKTSETVWTCNGILTLNCQEILHPTKPERYTGDPEAEIGCCILSAVNMLNVRNDKDHQRCCESIVRSLEEVIDLQEYPVKALENFAKNKRSLGVGVTNLAAWLASKGMNHNSPEALQEISDFMERQQYYLMQASMELAKERGAAPHWEQSKYATMSYLDTYNTKVDTLLETPYKLDWASLTEQIHKHGMRHMTLSAVMPCQSSSVVQNSTNGVEPINSLIIHKTSKTKTVTQCVPGVLKWKNQYLKRADIDSNEGLIRVNAVIQKWLCMSGSWNLYYKSHAEDGGIPLSTFVKDHITASGLGLKTFYYCNSLKKKDSLASLEALEETEDQGCAGGACSL